MRQCGLTSSAVIMAGTKAALSLRTVSLCACSRHDQYIALPGTKHKPPVLLCIAM